MRRLLFLIACFLLLPGFFFVHWSMGAGNGGGTTVTWAADNADTRTP